MARTQKPGRGADTNIMPYFVANQTEKILLMEKHLVSGSNFNKIEGMLFHILIKNKAKKRE